LTGPRVAPLAHLHGVRRLEPRRAASRRHVRYEEAEGPMPGTPAPTLGVEEELHVAAAATGRLVSRGREVLDRAEPDPRDGTVVAELTLSQVETVTAVSSGVEDALGRAVGLRRAAAAAAHEQELDLLACGTPVLGDADEQLVAPDERYLALRDRAAGLIREQLIAGMHVHVGTAAPGTPVASVDDDARVAVVQALRPWLPALLAMTANSPYFLGRDTGFASYRQVHWQRWPVAGPPPWAPDAREWHAAVASVVDAGVVNDATFVYWDVRLATRYPTVEVRVADVVPTVEDAGLFVALVRGLAARVLTEYAKGRTLAEAQPRVPQHALRAAMWRAARYGLSDRLVDPRTGTLVAAPLVVRGLLETALPGLEQSGDLDLAREGMRRLAREGNGAQRQRAAYERNGWAGVLDVVRVRPDAAAPQLRPAPESPSRLKGDGNGWVHCVCGQQHWGRHGAAGLLAVRPGAGGPEVLMQLRSPWTHQGGTWGLPGGARDSHESVSQAARREAHEETGVDSDALTDVDQVVVDHGPWSYTYVLATAPTGTAASVANRESDAVEWLPLDEIGGLELHPGLREVWPRLHDRVRGLSALTP
jgi:glutamate---cysteine ligase / carboxylate-amine ligase